MCDPLTASLIISGVTALGSGVASSKAASQVTDKRAEAIRRSEEALAGFRTGAQEGFQRSLAGAGSEQIKKATEEKRIEKTERFTKDIAPDVLLPGAASGSDAAKRAIIKSLTGASETSKERAGSRAAIEAITDALFGRDITLTRGAQDIARQGSFAAGRAGVTGLELDAANSAGSKFADIAGIINALGTVGSTAAGAGFFNPADSLATGATNLVRAPAFKGVNDPIAFLT